MPKAVNEVDRSQVKKINVTHQDVQPTAEVVEPEQLERYLYNPEFSKAADSLLGAVRHYFQAIKGVDPNRDQVHDIAVKILESRK